MTAYFVDTSALGKRYVVETGSVWIKSWIEPAGGNVAVVSELTVVEIFSLLARKHREGLLTPANLVKVQSSFLRHITKEYIVDLMRSSVLVDARNLIPKYPLRALDAIQLASALDAQTILAEPLVFVSADRNLLVAAASEGFTIDDPNAHP